MFWKHTTKNEEVEFNYIPFTVISDDLTVKFCKQYFREKQTPIKQYYTTTDTEE